MRIINLIQTKIFILLWFIQFQIILSINKILTSWTDPITGSYYDWSLLKQNRNNPYIIKDEEIDEENFSIKYYFNIGDILNEKCNNKTSSVVEVLEYNGEKTDICENLGHYSNAKINLLDDNEPNLGIVLEYDDGEICTTSIEKELIGLTRKTRFKIYCSSSNTNKFVLDYPEGKQGTTKCIIEFKIYSSAGCPKSILYKIKPSLILKILIIGFCMYMIPGFIYNKYFLNLRGKYAVPNFIFWRQFPMLVIEGAKLIIEIINRQINKFYIKFFYRKNNIK